MSAETRHTFLSIKYSDKVGTIWLAFWRLFAFIHKKIPAQSARSNILRNNGQHLLKV